MAGKFTRLQKSYRISADNINSETGKNEIPMYRGVVLAGAEHCKLPHVAGMIPLGVVDSDERLDDPLRDGGSQAGRQVAVKLEGIAMLEMSEDILVGDRIILDIDGKGKAVGDAVGEYEVLGFSEAAGDEGDVLPVRMTYHHLSVGEDGAGNNGIVPLTLEGYYADESGTALIVEQEVSSGTEEEAALDELPTEGFAKLSDDSYTAVTISWAFSTTYDKDTAGDYTTIGTVTPNSIGETLLTDIAGKITVG